VFRGEPKSLRDVLVRHGPALNFLRLGLALLVLVSHTYPLGGYGADPAWPTFRASTTVGGFAVGAFFALSGLLVTMSGLRRTPYEFLRSRFLRIVPAYVVVVLVVAWGLAPVIYWHDHGGLGGFVNLSEVGPVAYVARNLLFPVGLQYAVNDVFATTTPYGILTGTSAVNGSLWTLPLELRCYLVALTIVIIGRALGSTRVSLVALGFVSAILFVGHFDAAKAAIVTPAWMVPPLPELLFVFLCGAVLGTVAERLTMTWWVVVVAAGLYIAASVAGGLWFRSIGLGSLAVLLPAIAWVVPRSPVRWFRNDLSYGAYVWAFPVQQTLAYVGWETRKVLFVLLSTVGTLALAAASWFLVERPSLRLRHRADAEEPALTAVKVGAPSTG
jgi:peptidoglycan/LPS O-acetylase OafA/YrhL